MSKSKSSVHVVNPSDVLLHDKKFYRNVYLSVAAVALVIVGAIFVSQRQNVKIEENRKEAGVIFSFEEKQLADYLADKMEADKFLAEFDSMVAEVSPVSVLPIARQIYEKVGADNAQLLTSFEKLWNRSEAGGLARNFYSQYLAVMYETNGQYPKAIDVLKGELNSSFSYEAKLYFDLGRLHYLNKENDLAKNNFQHVIDHFADTEMAQLSRSFMERYGLDVKESNAATK